MKWKGVIIAFFLFGAGFFTSYGLYTYMKGGKESIDMIGSSTVFPIAIDTANEYMQEHQDVIINVRGGGSGLGYTTVINGKANIGTHSRKPDSREILEAKANNVNLTLYTLGLDVLTLIVHPSVVPNDQKSITLTRRQVGQIVNTTVPDEKYQIQTWGDVETHLNVTVADKAHNHEIKIFDREAGSGTRAVFLERCVWEYGYKINPDTGGVGSNKAMRQNVQDTKWSLGYIGLGYLTSNVNAVKIKENGTIFYPPVLTPGGSGSKNLSAYPLSRELYMSTDGYILENDSKSLSANYLKFVRNQTQIFEKHDFFPLEEPPTYRWSTIQKWR